MKKIKYIIFALFLSIILIPNVSAKGVEIKSITLDTKSSNTIEKSNPTHSGLTMNFDLAFKQKDDYAKYKVVVKNDTNIDYRIASDTSFNKSNYITYKYETTGDLKANSELTVLVTITYSNEIDPSLLVDDKYNETNKAVLKLLDKNGNPVNPNTGINTYLFITILLLSIIIVTLLVAKKPNKIKGFTIIIGLFLIPTLVYAVETLKLTININVEILREYKVAYITNESSLYTDSELEQLNIEEKMQCTRIYYIGEMTEESKYTQCHIKYIEDDETYSPGEKVEMKEIPFRKLKTKEYSVDDPGFYCNKQTTDTYLCDDNYVETTIFMKKDWDYKDIETEYEFIKNGGYRFFDNDKEVMKFSNIVVDEWDRSKRLQLEVPTSFTMPRHNVLFQQWEFI